MSVVKLPEVVEYLSKPDDFMKAKPCDRQQNLYEVQLEFLCDSRKPLMRLSQVIDCSQFDETFGNLYSEGQGRFFIVRNQSRDFVMVFLQSYGFYLHVWPCTKADRQLS